MQPAGQLADLVEEDRPGVGELELPGRSPMGPGEGPPLVAEQLGLQELTGERRTIDLDEGTLVPRGRPVNGSSDQVLADPALTADEDGCVRVGGLFDDFPDLLHLRAVGEQRGVVGQVLPAEDTPGTGRARGRLRSAVRHGCHWRRVVTATRGEAFTSPSWATGGRAALPGDVRLYRSIGTLFHRTRPYRRVGRCHTRRNRLASSGSGVTRKVRRRRGPAPCCVATRRPQL